MKIVSALSALLLAGVAHAAEPSAAQKALVGHWTLDDRAASKTVRDASPNALHGSFSADTATSSRQGRMGRSLEFPGRNFVDLARHAATLGKLTDFTLSMWIQYRGGASRILFSWSDGTLNHRLQAEVHQGRLHFGWQNGGGWQGFATRPLAWKQGEWYHVLFVNDSASGKAICRSNDGVWATSENPLGPSRLRVSPTHVEIGGLNGAYPFSGLIDDVRLYNIALCKADLRALCLGKPISGKPAVSIPVARLSVLEKDWFFQAERQPLLGRAQAEIGWAEEMASRLARDGLETALDDDLSALRSLKGRAQEMAASAGADDLEAWELYRAVRVVKRRIMLQHPEIDFDEVVFVDVPYTRGREWQHESRYRSSMCAAHGGELAVLKGLSPDGQVRRLAPAEGKAALLRPDVAYDGKSVLFCMKPEAQKTYHLYEIGVDGKGLRQITSGGYSDLDPAYLPSGGIVFLTSRANVYGGCAPWAPQHITARCDRDGKNIYLLSVASEPEYSPSVLSDGRLIYTRWEYNDKGLNRIQSLWTMNPDGTGSSTYWGNQSTYPDHLGEARSIPGTPLVMFNGMGHHDMYRGCIGVVDPARGTNFPDGLWKVTAEVAWPEVGDGPVPTPALASDYHASGVFGGYKSPYPLSRELFLVSARAGQRHGGNSNSEPNRGNFKLYLMDIYGNRELIHQGRGNVLYAQPLRQRQRPPVIPDAVERPGSEKDGKQVAAGIFYSPDVCEGLPEQVRGKAKHLRVLEAVQRTYTTGCVDGGGSPFGSGRNIALDDRGLRNGNPERKVVDVAWGDGAIFAGPAIAIASNTRLKRVHGTVPIGGDGSVCFEAPPGKALYFQLLDENGLTLHSMRSWVNLMPGERRGCVGCHEGQVGTPATRTISSATRQPDRIAPPSWGVRTLSYVEDIQPIFDKNCGKCHQGEGKARQKLDLTLRPDKRNRWGGIFPEPYITLTCGDNAVNNYASLPRAKPTIAGNFFIWAVPYTTIPPMTRWSYRSPLITLHLHGKHNGVKLTKEELGKLIAWVDTNCHFRSLADVLRIADPDPNWFLNWPYRPRLSSAPYVSHLHSHDEFDSPADRPPLRDRIHRR